MSYRILHVLSSLKKNGTETFVMNVLRKIDREKYQFDFLIFNDDKNGYYDEVKSYGCKVFYLPPRKKGLRAYNKNLETFFAAHNFYDTVHLHDMSLTSIAPLVYAKKHSIPQRIMHVHGANCQGIHNKIFHSFNKLRLSSYATDALSCSHEASKWGFGQTSLSSSSQVIANGIDLDVFAYNQEDRLRVRKEFDFKENERVLIHVGSFNPIKNQKFLIDVLKEIKNIKEGYKLLLVGQGELLGSVKEYSESVGVHNDVVFTGHRDDVSSLMSASDMLLFPSLHEGLGLVVVEGQASGLPCIVSSGVPEEVGVTPNFHRYNLSKGANFWAKKIIEIKNIDPSRKLPESITTYSIQKTVEQLCKIYQKGEKV